MNNGECLSIMKYIPDTAEGLVTLNHYLLSIGNSNFTGHSTFSFAILGNLALQPCTENASQLLLSMSRKLLNSFNGGVTCDFLFEKGDIGFYLESAWLVGGGDDILIMGLEGALSYGTEKMGLWVPKRWVSGYRPPKSGLG